MNSKAILVLGNRANRDLVEVLSSVDFIPQVWGSMRHSLDKLFHQRFVAVIIDRKFTHADVLEFILNVRDIDKKVPVVVIGNGKEEGIDKKIAKQDYTTVLGDFESGEKLAEKIEQVINTFSRNN
jgi:two-component SAPR family response regulator